MTTNTTSKIEATGVMKTLIDRSNDMGISWECLGRFDSKKELMDLLNENHPWELEHEELLDDTDLLLNDDYIELDDECIELFQIVDGNKLYVKYQDVDFVGSLMERLIYDTNKQNYLLGFSNTGWLRIDGAIDLETGTVGYYNDRENAYTPVGTLNDNDVEMMSELMDNVFFDSDPVSVAITRID